MVGYLSEVADAEEGLQYTVHITCGALILDPNISRLFLRVVT